MVAKRVFLSCVTNEFGSYRTLISNHLTESGSVEIEKQETFRACGEQTLIMLDDYIRSCDYVVHILGSQTGAIATAADRRPIIERYSYAQLEERLGLSKSDIDSLSYTQWEAWLAVLHDRKLLICTPTEDAKRDYSLNGEDPQGLQAAQMLRHMQLLTNQGRYADVRLKFADHNSLTLGLMRALQPKLRSPDTNKVVPKGLLQFDESAAGFYLKLLPPPYYEVGGLYIPEMVQHWKQFLESEAPSNSVGVLLGVSGSGKSSYFRAGVLPLLQYTTAGRIVDTIYLSASSKDFERRLMLSIKGKYPNLDFGEVQNLAEMMNRYASMESSSKRKLVIVIDQFEQWLQSWNRRNSAELVQTIRQCRADIIQIVLIVRDDFYSSVYRFMEAIDQDLTDINHRVLQLFDTEHAERVLQLFGRAYERVDESPTEQQLEFVKLAVAGLANENRNEVVCLRLSLFAFMMRGKPWNVATWKDVGGVDGLGVRFLEDTIGRGSELRFAKHRDGAKEVLRCLLPHRGEELKIQSGEEIKVQVGASELRRRSGYEAKSREFEELISVLHNELRLVTPSDGEHLTSASDLDHEPSKEQFYQLAHDFLIPAIREWLSLTQRTTPGGRAMLLLDARSTAWYLDKKRTAALPSIREYIIIRYRTKKYAWTDQQREMMKAAKKEVSRKLSMALAAITFIAICAVGGMYYLRYKDAKNAVDLLVKTALPQVDERIQEVTSYPLLAPPLLKNVLKLAENEEIIKAKLALLHLTGEYREDLEAMQYSADSNFETVDSIRRSFKRLGVPGDSRIERLAEIEREPARFCRLLVAIGEEAQSRIVTRDPERSAKLLASILNTDLPFLGDRYLSKSAIENLRDELIKLYQNDAGNKETIAYLLSKLGDTPKNDASRVCQVIAADSKQLFNFTLRALIDRSKPKEILREYVYNRQKLRDWAFKGPERIETETRVKKVWESAGFEYGYVFANLDKLDAMGVVALARLGEYDALWNLLNEQQSFGARSFAIKYCSELGVDGKALTSRLQGEMAKAKPDFREFEVAGLLLILGNERENDTQEHGALLDIVSTILNAENSSYVLSSAEWASTHLRGSTASSNSELTTSKSSADHPSANTWSNSFGQRFVLVDFEDDKAPLSRLVSKGTNTSTRRKVEVEPSWPRRKLWFAVREVTVAEWKQYIESLGQEFTWPRDPRQPKSLKEGEKPIFIDRYYPADCDKCPIGGIRRTDVLRYCNWLSIREGKVPFYILTEQNGVITELRSNSRSNGYRIPFSYEWELASRAGCDLSWFFGNSEELMERYVHCDQPSDEGVFASVGSKMPNTLGIFDSLGNAMEWVHDLKVTQEKGFLEGMHVRGGAYLIHPPNIDHATPKQRSVFTDGEENYDWVDGIRLARWAN